MVPPKGRTVSTVPPVADRFWIVPLVADLFWIVPLVADQFWIDPLVADLYRTVPPVADLFRTVRWKRNCVFLFRHRRTDSRVNWVPGFFFCPEQVFLRRGRPN